MKPIPTPKNVVKHLRAMRDRLNEGRSSVDDAWWTTEAATIIERLVRQRDEAEATQATIKAALDEARRIAAQQYAKHHNGDEDTLVRNFFEFRGWDCFKALEETARESYKGGD